MLKKLLIVLFVLLAAVVIYKWDYIVSRFRGVERTINHTEVKLLIRDEPAFQELLILLEENNVIDKKEKLRDYALEHHIDTANLAAGKFVILSGTTYPDLLKGFVKGANGHGAAEVKVNVIFNNCRDVYDIGSNISKCILADSASIVDHILGQSTLEKYQFTKEQIPALFLPQQYEMYFDTDAAQFVEFMASQFREFWNEERKAKMKELGFNAPSQVVTLASIVYSEQGKVKEEWPIIAKLYLNRLKKGMRLQSDPTFKFCWGDELDGVQRLLNRHRDIDCPYNTYKIDGLPPGPICITPASVIDAVLDPADVDYIFMCAKPDYSGEHNFTSSASAHQSNASAYQKWLANELNR